MRQKSMGIDSGPKIEGDPRISLESILCERRDVAEESEKRLKVAFERLNIPYPKLPKIEVKFVDSQDRPELGRTFVDAQSVQVHFDSRFATQEKEKALVDELKSTGLDYPGMTQALTHEVGHIALWSVLGTGNRPATRLLDEGWATLLEEAGSREDFEANLKQKAVEGFSSEPELFERCLDFRRVIDSNENLNGAEYIVGATILLWIRETLGDQVMLDVLRATLHSTERNDLVAQNLSGIQIEDGRLENVLQQTFTPHKIGDVRLGYLEWLKSNEIS